MELTEFIQELGEKDTNYKFNMNINETYASFNIDEATNVFIESFDGINFSINKMDRQSLKMETLKEVKVETTYELNYQINEMINKVYDFVS